MAKRSYVRSMRAVVAAGLMLAAGLGGARAALGAEDKLGITWEEFTLKNGLRVVLAPMPTSPMTHVRVLYHVGSRDERPDRQGFAHMFEHMMFRGSAHVPPQEHMKLVNGVGGYSNAFTSFDKTEYVDTVPSNYTEMALWLEADRMSSFKVSPQIFQTERLVVAEEWRIGQNRPYGTMWEELFAEFYQKAPYRWTPIGNMDQLRAAQPAELQAFFNKYYVPNNAVLVVAGNIDVAKTRGEVEKYFGWIPARGEEAKGKVGIAREIPQEPVHTEAKRSEVVMRVALPREVVVYPMPKPTDPDYDAAGVMMQILGDGRSSRLSRALVTNAEPLCVAADSAAEDLEDGGIMGAVATLLAGKDPAAVEKVVRDQIKLMRDTAVSPEELEKAKQQQRLGLATRFETAEKVTAELGETLLSYGSTERVKTARARLEALTAADVQRAAKRFLTEEQSAYLLIKPGAPTATDNAATPMEQMVKTVDATTQAATQAGAATQGGEATSQPVAKEAPKEVAFPADYPTSAPMAGKLPTATFAKGVESTIHGVKVIVMEDHRQPTIDWTLVTRMGGHAEPAGKEGLAGLTAAMVRRGPKGKTFDQFNEELESRGISIEVGDNGDNTRISGDCLTEQFPTALAATRSMLLEPAFDPAEFASLKAQSIDGLRNALTTNSAVIAGRTLTHALYGDSVLGRLSTPKTLEGITLDDVKAFYKQVYTGKDAVLMIAGDITVADGQKAAESLLNGVPETAPPAVTYDLPAPATERRILLVDNPDAKNATIRMAERAYDLHNDIKFAGSLAGQILSSGIESRLGQYVRAEKGYVYGVQGIFQPTRQSGAFVGSTETKFETTADTITAMLHVFDQMKASPVPEKELADAKFRTAGSMLMSMQTVSDQAAQRVTGVLNGYPIDYYDKYAARIGQVTAGDLQEVMEQYVQDDKLTIVVVAPAAAVKEQLEKIGKVEVLPMPSVE
jgi:zinc protease